MNSECAEREIDETDRTIEVWVDENGECDLAVSEEEGCKSMENACESCTFVVESGLIAHVKCIEKLIEYVRSAEGTGPEWLKHESLGYCPIGLASFWTLLIDSIAYAPYIVLKKASYTLPF